MADLCQNVERLVDPVVTRAKLEPELARFRADAQAYGRRGCWLADLEFPRLFFVFGTPNARPPALVFGATLDFTDYDFLPPSVQLVDPFTRVPYRFKELPTRLPQQAPAQGLTPDMLAAQRLTPEMLAAMGVAHGSPVQVMARQELMQAYDPDDVPILCLRGVREYHNNPGHSGDPWLLHRGTGHGSLADLLEQLLKYGVTPINGFQIQMSIALQQGAIPV